MAEDPIFDQIPESLARLGPDLQVRQQNSRSRETYGEATGTPCYKAHFGRSDRCPGCMIDEVFERGFTRRWYLADDRSERKSYYEITVSPLLDSEGRVTEVIEMIRDATATLAVEQHLIQTSEQLEQEVDNRTRELADLTERTGELREHLRELRQEQAAMVQTEKMASLGRLAAGLTHEIHTPLGALLSNLDMLRRCVKKIDERLRSGGGEPDLEELKRQVDTCGELMELQKLAADRIHKIVSSLRSFAHLDRAEEEPYDLHEGIDASLALLTHEIRGRIEVTRDYGELPPVACRPDALNQVFMNLLQNAVHAIEGPGSIHIATRVENSEAVLEFHDSGKGIAAENLAKVFEPGFTTKPRGVGTGLGLAMAYSTLVDHGGQIEARSEPGKGTSFILRLPLGREVAGA